MRKLLPIVATLAFLSALPSTSHAFGAFVGWWDGGDFGSGYGLGVTKGKSFTPLINIEGRASWFAFSGSPDVHIIPVEAVGKVSLGMLFGGAGIGWYFYDQGNKNDVGFQILGGAQLPLAALDLFGELRYVFASPADSNADADGFGINAGVRLNVLK